MAVNPNQGKQTQGSQPRGSQRAQREARNQNNAPPQPIGQGFSSALKNPQLQQAAQNQDRGFFGNIAHGIGSFFNNLFGGGQQAIGQALNRLPDSPNFQERLDPTRRDTVREVEVSERARFNAAREDQQRAEGVARDVGLSTEALSQDIEGVRQGLAQREEDLQGKINEQEARIASIGEGVDQQFQQAQEQFNSALQGSLGRVGEARDDALAGVFQGQSAAMEAAVQGTQSQVRSQIAAIDANQNLTPAQKESMKAQVKMGGALQLNAAVGQTQLQFNTLAANTATQFGQILGGVETAGLSGTAQLGQARADSSLQAQSVAGQLGNELVNIRSTSAQNFASQQSQLLGLRSEVEMTGNQLAANLLPAQATPYLDYTGSAILNLQTMNGLITKDFSAELGVAGLDIKGQAAMAAAGSPLSNFLGIVGSFLGG